MLTHSSFKEKKAARVVIFGIDISLNDHIYSFEYMSNISNAVFLHKCSRQKFGPPKWSARHVKMVC